jgi:hypothetical protein
VTGNEREGVVRLDAGFAMRLSDPDPQVRNRCALDLLRLGPSRLDAIELVEPTTDEGRALRDKIVEAVTALARNEAGEDYPRLPEENRLELRLKYWGQVVPDSMLAAERKAMWTRRTADDAERVARGTISEAQAAWHRLELAYARRQLGEIGEDEWVKVRAEQMPLARAFVLELGARQDLGRDHVQRVQDALDRMER